MIPSPADSPDTAAALDVDTLFKHPEGLKAARLLVMKVVLGATGADAAESKSFAPSLTLSQTPAALAPTPSSRGRPDHLSILQSAADLVGDQGESKGITNPHFGSRQAMYAKYRRPATLPPGSNMSSVHHRLGPNDYVQDFTFSSSTAMTPSASMIPSGTIAKPPNTLLSNFPTTRRPSLSSSHLGNPYLSARSNNSADPYNLAQGTAILAHCPRSTQPLQSPAKPLPQQPHFSTLPSQSRPHASQPTHSSARPQLSVQTRLTPSTLPPSSNRPIRLDRPRQPAQPAPSSMPRLEQRELLPRPIEPRPLGLSVTDDVGMGGMSTPTSASKKRKAEDDDLSPTKRARTDDGEKPKRLSKSKTKKVDIAKYNVSNDIWLRILEYCPPLFLNKARLISKNFKHMVDELDSLHVNNRKENFGYDMPAPPPGLTERQYMNLLGGKGCMAPGCDDRLATRTHWPWMKRWCHACWEKRIERDDRIIKTRQSGRYNRTCLEKLLECIPVGMHDSFKKPHDYVLDDAENPRRNATRLYKYHLTRDVDKIMRDYDALEPMPYQENPAHSPAEKAAALADYQQLMAALDGKREEFLASKKREQDAKLQLVMQIEAGIRMRRDKNRKPHDANRSARYSLFISRAAQDIPQIPEEFVKSARSFKAATRIFRDSGSERGWLALKPKILKEWQNHQAQEGQEAFASRNAHAMSREQSFSSESQIDDESRLSAPPPSSDPGRSSSNLAPNYSGGSIFGGVSKIHRDLSTTLGSRSLGMPGIYSHSLTPNVSRSSSLSSYSSPAQQSTLKFDEPSRYATSSPANFATNNQHAMQRALYGSQYASSSRLSSVYTLGPTSSMSHGAYGGAQSRMSISSLCGESAPQHFSRGSYPPP